jgi:uroporphyrinogen III methyltransferase/synthase
VDVVPAYETRPVEKATLQPLKEALGTGQVDAILLTSSSTVTNLCSALGEDNALLGRTLLASIGPITTSTATEQGLRVGVTASVYTVAALVDALQDFWGTRARRSTGRAPGARIRAGTSLHVPHGTACPRVSNWQGRWRG